MDEPLQAEGEAQDRRMVYRRGGGRGGCWKLGGHESNADERHARVGSCCITQGAQRPVLCGSLEQVGMGRRAVTGGARGR